MVTKRARYVLMLMIYIDIRLSAVCVSIYVFFDVQLTVRADRRCNSSW